LASYDIQQNDLIISRSGSVGDICVIPANLGDSRFSTNIMRLSFLESSINPQFFSRLFLGAPMVLKQVAELCRGSTRLFLNQKILSSISYPIPPIEEQNEIIHRIERFFSFADQIEQRIKDAQSRVNHLTQSILAKAFRGELTAEWREQNPDLISGENSAQALLERIKAEQANLKPKEKARKKSAA
jgi:type I restriction enzyme, S subunit